MSGGPGDRPRTMSAAYADRWIDCTPDAIVIRGYYFPWGSKRILYASIRSIRRVDIGPLSGRWRIWGTSNLRYWASLDPRRPSKEVALVLDLGAAVQPFVTPDDPDAFEATIRQHTHLGTTAQGW
jgi:hypothetical protein